MPSLLLTWVGRKEGKEREGEREKERQSRGGGRLVLCMDGCLVVKSWQQRSCLGLGSVCQWGKGEVHKCVSSGLEFTGLPRGFSVEKFRRPRLFVN